MKRFVFITVACCIISGIWLLHTACTNSRQKGNHQFEKSGEVVLNPGKGWILYGNAFEHSPDVIALGTTGYRRFDWCDLNPQEDVYDWSPIDDAVSAWAQFGKQFAFGVMSLNANGNVYCTPKWVFDKGANYTVGKIPNSTEKEFYIPVWDDPVYVAECKKFAEALAVKYDDNPNIAFIDIRNYGNWGEMHMFPFFQYTKYLSDDQLKELLIRPYLDNFIKTQIVICDIEPPHSRNNMNNWVVNNGIGLRIDGIMGNKKLTGTSGDGDVVSMAIGKQPIVWELLGTFKSFENNPNKSWDDKRFINIIKTYKPNFINMGGWGTDALYMLNQKTEMVREVANLMGYNLSMASAKYPDEIPAGEAIDLSLTIENSGVTNMLSDCVTKIALFDSNDEIVSLYTTNWNLQTIGGGKTSNFTAKAVFENIPAGSYHLALGLYSNVNDQMPTYRLDNKGRTPEGFYTIGMLKIE